ncbi:MAG: hypothetical protein P8179_07940 [Candidatus Thiodiazotropha sp.]
MKRLQVFKYGGKWLVLIQTEHEIELQVHPASINRFLIRVGPSFATH